MTSKEQPSGAPLYVRLVHEVSDSKKGNIAPTDIPHLGWLLDVNKFEAARDVHIPGQTATDAQQWYWRTYGEAGNDQKPALSTELFEIPTEDDRIPEPGHNVLEGPWSNPSNKS